MASPLPPPGTDARNVRLLPIAEGGMGFVEAVLRRDGGFERLYARKRLRPEHRRDAGFRAMFMDEARLAGLVRHPNVVSVLDVGEDAEGPFFIMEYVEGVSVARLLRAIDEKGERVPLQVALRLGLEAARGLHAAHEALSPEGEAFGLVPRDVSTQNVLLGFDGVARVSDFGIAKAFGNASRTTTGS